MRCRLSLPKQTDISAFKNSTSNLRKHVTKVHPNKLSKYTDLLESHRKRKSSSSSDTPVKNAKITAFTAVHMGLLLPTLYQLRDKLKRLESSCKTSTPLVHALQQGIQKRFGDIMKEPELIAAPILLPRFRTSWTTEENILNAGLDYIRNHLDADLDEVISTNSSPSDEDDFFASKTQELERYLSRLSPAGMDLLHTFPHSKKLSLKVNTGLPASAACERLFSNAGLLFIAKRSQLHCKNLESQLLLKLNRDITE
uniref:HAT C-terminal dimerisation domain-containing protein n=1 Tax=Larimichthys crocea TaxID=215358 RepID=A0A0F8CGS4_LARCR